MDKILRCFLKFHELFYIYSLSSVDAEIQDTPKKGNIIKVLWVAVAHLLCLLNPVHVGPVAERLCPLVGCSTM